MAKIPTKNKTDGEFVKLMAELSDALGTVNKGVCMLNVAFDHFKLLPYYSGVMHYAKTVERLEKANAPTVAKAPTAHTVAKAPTAHTVAKALIPAKRKLAEVVAAPQEDVTSESDADETDTDETEDPSSGDSEISEENDEVSDITHEPPKARHREPPPAPKKPKAKGVVRVGRVGKKVALASKPDPKSLLQMIDDVFKKPKAS